MALLLWFLIPLFALGGLGLVVYGLDANTKRGARYIVAGAVCVGGGVPATVTVASHLASQQEVDPWECVHTHKEEECHTVPLLRCIDVDVCDLKRLRDAGGKD